MTIPSLPNLPKIKPSTKKLFTDLITAGRTAAKELATTSKALAKEVSTSVNTHIETIRQERRAIEVAYQKKTLETLENVNKTIFPALGFSLLKTESSPNSSTVEATLEVLPNSTFNLQTKDAFKTLLPDPLVHEIIDALFAAFNNTDFPSGFEAKTVELFVLANNIVMVHPQFTPKVVVPKATPAPSAAPVRPTPAKAKAPVKAAKPTVKPAKAAVKPTKPVSKVVPKKK